MLDVQIEHANDDLLVSLHKESRDLDTAELIDFLTSRLAPSKTYYVIIDGLDECELGEIRMVAQGVSKLCTSSAKSLKILCTGRPELERELFKGFQPKYKITLTGEEVDMDITRYITTTLDQRLEDKQLKLGDPIVILKIVEALQKGSQGM